jgi:hypothetical protein
MVTSPTLRKVAAEVLTAGGWLSGTLHVPSHLALEEHLALGRHDLKFTGVCVPKEPDRVRFLALRRDAIILCSPALAEVEAATSQYTIARQVSCLFPGAVLRGTMQVFSNHRLSDFLQLQGHMVTLHHCLHVPYGGTANSAEARALAMAVVNLNHALGISEEG